MKPRVCEIRILLYTINSIPESYSSTTCVSYLFCVKTLHECVMPIFVFLHNLGIAGPKGLDGFAGDVGDIGPPGPTGPQGVIGFPGLTGEQGERQVEHW